MRKVLELSAITNDPSVSPRRTLDQHSLEVYSDGAFSRFPPITIFMLPDETRLLADGFHRFEVAKRSGLQTLTVEQRKGTREEAVQFAITANLTHGKPLSPDERSRAI
jgi:ParB-like chromosome segregation protein Spo0J